MKGRMTFQTSSDDRLLGTLPLFRHTELVEAVSTRYNN